MVYRINYSKVISQAHAIEDNAAELAAQIKVLEQMEQDCRSVWKGQAADSFITKLRTLRSEMYRTKNQLSNLSSAMNSLRVLLLSTIASIRFSGTSA